MTTYTPLFSKIVDSSLWMEPPHVVKLFLTMLALKDADHVVRFNAYGLCRRSNLSETEVAEGLEILANPDRRRMEPQANDGRRIERVAEGYRILSGEFYQTLMRKVNRDAYKARKQREYRARERSLLDSRRGDVDPGKENCMESNGHPEI